MDPVMKIIWMSLKWWKIEGNTEAVARGNWHEVGSSPVISWRGQSDASTALRYDGHCRSVQPPVVFYNVHGESWVGRSPKNRPTDPI